VKVDLKSSMPVVASVEYLPGRLIERVKETLTTSVKAETPGLTCLSDPGTGDDTIEYDFIKYIDTEFGANDT
jgi:hypothetical protein